MPITWALPGAAIATGRGHPRHWHVVAALLVISLGPASEPTSFAVGADRTVAITFAVDETVRSEPFWRAHLTRMLEGASEYFSQRYGLRFAEAEVTTWHPRGTCLEDYLDALRANIDPQPERIVVGLTLERPDPPSVYGLASYLDAVMVLSLPQAPSDRRLAFLHELAHVFGALHLTGEAGLMSTDQPADEIEPLNHELVALNCQRLLQPHLFPLPPNLFEKATGLYRRALEKAPQEATIALAQIAIETGDYQQALDAAESLLKLDRHHTEAHNLRGIALRRLGRPADAVSAYQNALRRRPNYAQVHYNMAIALERLADIKGAIASYQRALELQPGHLRTLSNLARLLAREGRPRQAAEYAERALGIEPRFAEARVNLALSFLKLGELDRALDESQQALTIEPQLAEAHEVLGAARLESGQVQMALASFSRAAEIRPNEPRFRHQVASAALKAGDRKRARQALGACLRLDPDYAPALTDLGGLDIQEGKPHEALPVLKKAVSLDSGSGPALIGLASAHLALGQIADAEAACRQALLLAPDSPAALTTLGAIAAERGSWKEALELHQRAARLAPHDVIVTRNLAIVYHQLGRDEDARRAYERVLEVAPDDATSHNNLAVLCFHAGDLESARAHAERALELGVAVHPDFLKALEAAERQKDGSTSRGACLRGCGRPAIWAATAVDHPRKRRPSPQPLPYRDDPHFPATFRAQEWVHLEDFSDPACPMGTATTPS